MLSSQRCSAQPEDLQALADATIPMKRLAQPEEIAKVVVFLASMTRATSLAKSCTLTPATPPAERELGDLRPPVMNDHSFRTWITKR